MALRAFALASGWLRCGQLDQRWVSSPHPQQASGCLVLDALAMACSAKLAQTVHWRMQSSAVSWEGDSFCGVPIMVQD